MAITVEVGDDGRLTYISDKHVVVTGPISGELPLPNGKIVNVGPPVVEVDSPEEAAMLSNAIGHMFEKQGHPNINPNEPGSEAGFVHIPTEIPNTED